MMLVVGGDGLMSGLRVRALAALGALAYLGLMACLARAENEIELVGTFGYGVSTDLVVAGDKAFVATVAGLMVLDISDPEHPRAISERGAPYVLGRVVVKGDYAFAQVGYEEIQAIDISDPTQPRLVGPRVYVGWLYDLQVDGDYLFAVGSGSWDQGLSIIDISDPASPFEVGFLDSLGWVGEVMVSGVRAFVRDLQGHGTIVDASDPAHPVKLGDFGGWVIRGMGVAGDYLYVGEELLGVLVFDIADPAAPREAATYITWSNLPALAVEGDRVCIVDLYSGLNLIDVSDPGKPVDMGSYVTPGRPYGLHMRDDLAFVADSYKGLTIVDIADPYEPQGIGFVATPKFAHDVDLAGDIAHVAASDAGVRVIDMSDASAPWEIRGVAAAGGAAACGDLQDGRESDFAWCMRYQLALRVCVRLLGRGMGGGRSLSGIARSGRQDGLLRAPCGHRCVGLLCLRGLRE
jgi:hypothetical protein